MKALACICLLPVFLISCTAPADQQNTAHNTTEELLKSDDYPSGFQAYFTAEAKAYLNRYRKSDSTNINWDQDIKRVSILPLQPKIQSYALMTGKAELAQLVAENEITLPPDSLFAGGMLVKSLTNGRILAWVENFFPDSTGLDHITADVQAGSLMQPFIYATAIFMQGFSPCMRVPDSPVTFSPGDGDFGIEEEWNPHNFSGTFSGEVLTMKDAFSKQLNSVPAFLMKQLGSAKLVRDLLHNMGIDKNRQTENGIYRIPEHPKMAIGAFGLSLYEMVTAYSIFGNNGMTTGGGNIASIEIKDGTIFHPNREKGGTPVLTPSVNSVMLHLLQNNLTQVEGINAPLAGMPGKTFNSKSGSFIGMTPELIVGVWLGAKKQEVPIEGSRLTEAAQNIFISIVKRIEADSSLHFGDNQQFYQPPNAIIVDCEVYEKQIDLDDSEGFDSF